MKNTTLCYKISETGICPNFHSKAIIKNGFTKNKKRQYFCKSCCKRSIDFYSYNSYRVKDKEIVQLNKEGLGIRSTARVLKISATTLLKRIIAIAKCIPSQPIYRGKTYEVDEMRSCIKNYLPATLQNDLIMQKTRIVFR